MLTNKKKRKVPTQQSTTTIQTHTTQASGIITTSFIRPTETESESESESKSESKSELESESESNATNNQQHKDHLITIGVGVCSYYVRMRKRPISSPRHYGRQLHKLTRAHSQIHSNSSNNPLDTLNELEHDLNAWQTPIQHNCPPPRYRPQHKKPNKRSLTPSPPRPITIPEVQQPTQSSNPLPLPILPNLYDPALPIDFSYPSYPYALPAPTPSTSYYPAHPQQPSRIPFPPPDYDGQFSFRLEMQQVCQRLLGLHLAISTDKQNRAVQVQEAMRIAMETLNHPTGPTHYPQDSALTSTRTSNTPSAQVAPLTASRPDSHSTQQNLHSQPTRQSSTGAADHGPSGPPPSEPPPPLPPAQKHPGSAGEPPATSEALDGRAAAEQTARKDKKKGKKKRSAHANANNIHHRDNYVPSRLPASYALRPGAGGPGLLGGRTKEWARVRVEYEGRRGKRGGYIDPTVTSLDEAGASASAGSASAGGGGAAHCQLGPSPIARFFVEPDEWICAFCEHELWFGDNQRLLSVIKNRKQVLRRRRRAKERAARAASGIPPTTTNTNINPASTTPATASVPPAPSTAAPPPASTHPPSVPRIEPGKGKKSKNRANARGPTCSLPTSRRPAPMEGDAQDDPPPLPPLSSQDGHPASTDRMPPDKLACSGS
ncbi:hypothetical protein PCASD_19219 [Puccinia coronata f. sp. avenae]|uniref:Uncharacterized protein n=1 Tax=Puccinia coronata f. sp. avenae TaxID=200324 RepID=A0A2N5SX59_9BASI|nr:hypothetical protein PCASD_19219 [Puccinia coronata f. sp. avenae]